MNAQREERARRPEPCSWCPCPAFGLECKSAAAPAGCGPECAEQHTYGPGCGAQIDNGQTHNEPVVDEDAAPPASALRDQLTEAVHATSVCEVGDPVRCGRGCRDAAAAVLPVVQAELRRVSALHADTERRLRTDLAAEVRKREAAEAAWTPPPPGDHREQLPEHLLALVGVPLYLSTACEIAHRLDLYRTDSPLADKCAQWAERMHQRCRLNNKFTGEPCSCACHTPKEPTP